jgi:Periplasmic binding protein-like domain
VPSTSAASTSTTTTDSSATSIGSSAEAAAAAASANGHADGVTANGESSDVTEATVTEAGVTAERHSWLQHIAPPSKVLLCDDSAPAAVLQLCAVHGSTVGARTSMLCYNKQVSSCEH